MKKIAIVHSSLDRGGLTKVIYYITKFIDKSEFEITIFTFSIADINSELPDFLRENIKVVCLNNGKGFVDLIKNLKKGINNYKPDLIHTHSFRGSFFTSIFLKNQKHLATIHGNLKDNYIATYGWLKGNSIAFLEEFGFRNAHYKTVVSESLAFYIKPKSNGRVINNGIDSSKYYTLNENEKFGRRMELEINPKSRIFVTHGGVIERKNLEFLANAFSKAKLNEDTLLFIIGTGNLFSVLKEKFKSNKSIHWLGYENTPSKYLQIADYYFSASLSEGMPNSALEAISCGLFPILSNIPAHQDLIAKSGVPHRLFSPTKSSELIEIFNSMPDLIPIKSKYDFSVERMVKEYEDYYREIISGKEILI
jgi:glycosyltransferase involved in cell wall biosynthesis